MAQKALYDLTLKISANSAELARGIKEANSKIDGFQKNVGTQLKGVQDKFLMVTGAIGGVIGAFKSIEGVMNSTEGSADKLEFTIAGLKGGFNSLLRNLSTASFGNILTGFQESYRAAKKLAEQFDELEVFSAFSNWEIAGLKRQSSQLKEAASDMNKTKEERAKIWGDIENIEEQIFIKTRDLADKRLQLEKDNWTSINKVAVEGAMKAYQTSLTMTDEQQQQMLVIYGRATAYYNHFKKGALETQEAIAKNRMLAAGFTQDQVDSYMTLQKLERGEKDNLIKLYNFQMTAEEKKYDAQMRYNAAVRKETGLEVQAGKESDKNTTKSINLIDQQIEKLIELGKKYSEVSEQPNYAVPATPFSYGDTFNKFRTIRTQSDIDTKPEKKESENFENDWTTAISNVESAFESFANTVHRITDDGKVSFTEWLSILSNIARLLESFSGFSSNKEDKNIWSGMGSMIGIISTIGSLFGFAGGTSYSPEGWSMVGERGPELVNLSRGSQVYSNLQTRSMLGGNGGEVRFEIDGTKLVGVLNNYNRKITNYA